MIIRKGKDNLWLHQMRHGSFFVNIKENFHWKHAVTVEDVMRYFSAELGYNNAIISYKRR